MSLVDIETTSNTHTYIEVHDNQNKLHVQTSKLDVHGTVHRYCILLSITNKTQRYIIFFIIVNALHVSGGFCAIIRSSKTAYTASGIFQAYLLLPLAVAASKLDIYQMLCVQF